MSVLIYGASDDLIELEGDLYEEFYANTDSDNKNYIAFSTGAVVTIEYDDDGIWKIRLINKGDGVDISQCPPEQDEIYTDTAEIFGQVKWAVCGTEYAGKK